MARKQGMYTPNKGTRRDLKQSLLGQYFEKFPNDLEEEYRSAIESGQTTPYYNQSRTLMTPTDTIKFNTSHGVYNEQPGDMEGYFLGQDQNFKPVIVGRTGASHDRYIKDVEGEDWGKINNPDFYDGPQEYSGNISGKNNTFRDKGSDYRVKIKSVKDYPHIMKRLRNLGY